MVSTVLMRPSKGHGVSHKEVDWKVLTGSTCPGQAFCAFGGSEQKLRFCYMVV